MGDKRLPAIAAEDIGKIAYGVFKRPDLIGQTVVGHGRGLTGAQMAEKLSKALGETVTYNDVDPDVYRSFGFPGADEIGNMFQFKRDFEAEYAGARDPRRPLARPGAPGLRRLARREREEDPA